MKIESNEHWAPKHAKGFLLTLNLALRQIVFEEIERTTQTFTLIFRKRSLIHGSGLFIEKLDAFR
jgi:hypothetical protein